jgi:hypothetical protein
MSCTLPSAVCMAVRLKSTPVESGRGGNARLAPAFLLLNWLTRRAQLSEEQSHQSRSSGANVVLPYLHTASDNETAGHDLNLLDVAVEAQTAPLCGWR